MTLHRIERIESRPGYHLLVHWTSGEESMIDFSPDISTFPVWAPLRDEGLFAKVRILDEGMAIEWPDPPQRPGWPCVDVDADGLWQMAERQSAVAAAE